MDATTLLQRRSISVSEFRCSAGPDDTPFVERHRCHSVSYLRKGSLFNQQERYGEALDCYEQALQAESKA